MGGNPLGELRLLLLATATPALLDYRADFIKGGTQAVYKNFSIGLVLVCGDNGAGKIVLD